MEGEFNDPAGGSTILTGTSDRFYNDYDDHDPVGAYKRGYYFDGSSSLMTISDLELFAPEFSISIWVMPEGDGTILSKKDNSYVPHIEIEISSNKPILTFVLAD